MRIISSSILAILIYLSFSCISYAELNGSDIDNAQKAYDNNDYKTAIDKFTKAQIDKPDDAKIKYNIGNSLYRLNDFEKALTSFSSAITNKSNNKLKSKLYYNMGNT